MTTPSAPVPPPPPAATGADGTPSTTEPRRPPSLPALLAAAGVVVVTVVLVLLFGIARPPELTGLAEDPEPGLPAVAWVHWDRDSCLNVATADGETREVTCGLRGEEILGWEAEGIALAVWGPSEQLEVVDPVTGEVEEVRPLERDVLEERERGFDAVNIRRHDGLLTVRLDGTTLWEVDAPEAYGLNPGSVSPDGRHVAAFDSADRLLLLDATGERPPRVWLDDVQGWQAPVWEGTPVPATDD